MYLLPCPHCQQNISVTISQAGTQATCAGCDSKVQIPKLGELRQLETASDRDRGDAAAKTALTSASGKNSGRRMVFAGLMVVAGMATIAGVFCLIRYVAVEVPTTSELHIAQVKSTYEAVPAAQLVREWQQLEKYSLDVAMPYGYKRMEVEKTQWGRNGLICLSVLVFAVISAVGLGLTDSGAKTAN